MIGWSIVTVGALLAGSQVMRDTPWQAGVLLGIVLIVAGGVMVAERRVDA